MEGRPFFVPFSTKVHETLSFFQLFRTPFHTRERDTAYFTPLPLRCFPLKKTKNVMEPSTVRYGPPSLTDSNVRDGQHRMALHGKARSAVRLGTGTNTIRVPIFNL